MSWNFTRSAWSYVISKLGIFTDVNPAQLQVSGTSLTLTDVSIDSDKLANDYIDISMFVIGSLKMELQMSGLDISVADVQMSCSLTSLAPPDLAISTLLEQTRENLTEISTQAEPDAKGGPEAKGGLAAKFADMVLSQINLRVHNFSAEISIALDQFRVHIDELLMPHRNRIEFESVTVTADKMEQSIMDNFGASDEIAVIDRAVVDFDLDPLKCCIEIDHIRLNGLAVLEVVVLLLNEIIFAKPPSESTESAPVDLRCDIDRVKILDSLDSMAPPLVIAGISFEPPKAKIETVSMDGVLHVTPFVSMQLESPLELFWEVPVSISIPLESLDYLADLANRAIGLLTQLRPPEDPEPAPMNIFLPEVRIALGNAVTAHIFPHRITESGVQIREVLLTAGDGQVLVSDIYFGLADGLLVDRINGKLTDSFIEQVSSLKPAAKSDSVDEWTGMKLPEINMNFREILLRSSEMQLRAVVNVQGLAVNAQVAATLPSVQMSLDLEAKTDAFLQAVEADLHFKELEIDVEPPTESNEAAPFVLPPLPRISAHVSLEKAVLNIDKATFYLNLGRTSALLSDGISIRCPSLALDVADPQTLAPVPVLKASGLSAKHRGLATSVAIDGVALSCCADSYAFLMSLPAVFDIPEPPPQLKVEADHSFDIFGEISESQFVSQADEEVPSKRTHAKLDIKEDYIREARDQTTALFSNSAEECESSMSLEIRSAQWQLYDGFDFERSQKVMKKVVDRVSKAAQKLQDHEDDNDDEEAAVGDFMYQSVIVTTPAKAKDLKKTVAQELNTTAEFVRSMDPKVVLSLKRTKATVTKLHDSSAEMVVAVKDVKVSDLVSTSKFKHLLWAETKSSQDLLTFTKSIVGPEYAPEVRGSLYLQPLRVSLDQDTLEFLYRFFQYDGEEKDEDDKLIKEDGEGRDVGGRDVGGRDGEGSDGEETKPHAAVFIQRFEFGGFPLTIDYKPRKVDYKSLRSGTAAELLNIFAVKGARLTLAPSVVRGINGWDALLVELLEQWMPDIRANQLTALIAGVSPVRRALRVGKGVSKYTVVPIKRTPITKGAGVVVRKTVDELLRLKTSWLDSTDSALSG